MAKIAFIGAGSFNFTRTIVADMLRFPALQDTTFSLMDIDRERLDFARRAIQVFIDRGKYPARVEATMNREEALKGADVVVVTILVGGYDVWRWDTEIPKKYGVDTNIGDTRSVSGIFRGLRTVPPMLDIQRSVERQCPNALLLSYTNPMAILCRAMQKVSKVQSTGLCHSVQHTANMLTRWIGAKPEEITYTCAGINHQAFFLDFKRNGKDAYPAIRKAIQTRKKIYNEEIVRNEMFLALGYYVTESSGHSSEYNWWFRKRKDLIEKYCTHGAGFNPGVYNYNSWFYHSQEKTWKKKVVKWFKDGAPWREERSVEYAADIMNALVTNQPFVFNGNVPNCGAIDNYPPNSCVEVPVVVDRKGFSTVHVGTVPPQIAALNRIQIDVENMAADAAITGDPELVYHATVYDPLCASVMSLAEIRKMVNEMLRKNKPYLPQFRKFEA